MGGAVLSFKSVGNFFTTLIWMALGAFLTAVALEVFLIPNNIIDGGIVGVSIILSFLFSRELLPYFLVFLNIPFLVLAYRHLGKYFVIQMLASIILLAVFLVLFRDFPSYKGDAIEVIFSGGLTLGIGIGLIIRKGGALDGTEIVAILVNRVMGFTVGQVVLFFNIFIFAIAGLVYNDWHTAVQSLMTYVVAIKIMDMVIVGLEETKAVLIISSFSDEISKSITHELGLGLTILYGRGGFSGEKQEVLYVIIERLQLAELKELVQRVDPKACLAIENLHEVVNGRYTLARTESTKKYTFSNPLRRLWRRKKRLF